MSFLSVLFLIFIVLKLVGVIHWSWWIVLLPIYGGILATLALYALIGASFITAIMKRN